MIIINSPSFKKEIIELLETNTEGATFKHLKTEGIKMYFESSDHTPESAKLAKQIIKSSPQGSVMFFQVQYEE